MESLCIIHDSSTTPDIKTLKIYGWLILLALCAFTMSAYAQKISGKVVSIKDGDTIELLSNGKLIKVRLFGIDCPEKSQDFGIKAKMFTSDKCFGKIVTVVGHGNDQYRRLLGDVILPDNSNLNHELVKEGYAWRYKYSKDKSIFELEQSARAKKKGLWSTVNPQAPWDFRHLQKSAKRAAHSKQNMNLVNEKIYAAAYKDFSNA